MPIRPPRCPPHLRTRQRLLTLIDGLVARGADRLPSERQLVEELGASMRTVKKAIRQLASEGRLASAQRDGHFIRPRRTVSDIGVIIGEGEASTYVAIPGLLAGILAALERQVCAVRLLHIRQPAEAAHQLGMHRLDGCIWYMPKPAAMPHIAAAIRAGTVPMVVPTMGPFPEDPVLAPCLYTYDYAAVGRTRTEHALALGHRRIVCCMAADASSLPGHAAALQAHGIPMDHELIVTDARDMADRLPALLGEGGATAIIADGGFDRLDALMTILAGLPWNGRGDLIIDHLSAGHGDLVRRHPQVRIAGVSVGDNAGIGRRAVDDLVAAIRLGVPLPGFRCGNRIVNPSELPG